MPKKRYFIVFYKRLSTKGEANGWAPTTTENGLVFNARELEESIEQKFNDGLSCVITGFKEMTKASFEEFTR